MISFLKNKAYKTASSLKKFSLNVFDGGFIGSVFKRTDRAFGKFIFDQLDHEEKSESFSSAVKRFNLTEEDLAFRRIKFLSLSRLYLGFFFIAIALGTFFLSFQSVVSTLGLSLIPLSLWFKWSFRAWQIRVRKLAGVRTFISTDKWWIECFMSK